MFRWAGQITDAEDNNVPPISGNPYQYWKPALQQDAAAIQVDIAFHVPSVISQRYSVLECDAGLDEPLQL
ncbi:hypothetical protein NPIL_270101 [Nephila pilipes]|uniref:Uncharacterized protein n=1 Tax=Nephila pilipes TaxID=299642 RepID=A0A8X6PJ23_NEPPI|nr:hypothetical protein NPIL_288701 [Nephila pilipes]GFT73905.1 hypothetical protein NPIL_270101 [Nephila pilipes]